MSDFGDQLRPGAARMEQDDCARARQEAYERQAANERFDRTRATVAALAAGVFRPLLEEFAEVLRSEGVVDAPFVRQEGAGRGLGHGRRQFTFGARSRRYSLRCFHVSLLAVPRDTGAIELSAECVQNGTPGPGNRTTWEPLIELPRETVAPDAAQADAARQWCVEVLKRAAEAILEANYCFRRTAIVARVGAPVAAPVYAVPALDPGGVLST
jgi:hypothetical protein